MVRIRCARLAYIMAFTESTAGCARTSLQSSHGHSMSIRNVLFTLSVTRTVRRMTEAKPTRSEVVLMKSVKPLLRIVEVVIGSIV